MGLLAFDGGSQGADKIKEFLALGLKLGIHPEQVLDLLGVGEFMKRKRKIHTGFDAIPAREVPLGERESGNFLESFSRPGSGGIDAAKNHGQLRGGDGEFVGASRGKEEGAFLQTMEIDGEAIAHPGEDLESMPSSVSEDEEVTGGWVASEEGADDACESVNAFTTILRLDGEIDGAGHTEGDHDVSPRVWMSRASWRGSAASGTRS